MTKTEFAGFVSVVCLVALAICALFYAAQERVKHIAYLDRTCTLVEVDEGYSTSHSGVAFDAKGNVVPVVGSSHVSGRRCYDCDGVRTCVSL